MNSKKTKYIHYEQLDDSLSITVGGNWYLNDGLLDFKTHNSPIRRIQLYEKDLLSWDSSLISFLVKIRSYAESENIKIDFENMSHGVQKLLFMSQKEAFVQKKAEKRSFLYKTGTLTLSLYHDLTLMLHFLGQIILSFARIITNQTHMRWSDFCYVVQNVGAAALPIVSLIAFLTGFIMAFVGAIQLEKFGATIYIANLVGLAMVREMGPIMAAVIMCGRTGAAFAATIGTMKVNEELDALTTSGISVTDFVVLPRLLALICMMPLLSVFSDFVGIIGGFFIGVGVMQISFAEYLNQTKDAITLTDFWIGILKGAVFGGIVSFMGSLRGIQCGSDSGAVGIAATSAVVTGITFIIIVDAIFAVILNVLNL